MSQLADFMKENGITPQAVIDSSRALETQGVDDRSLAARRSIARKDKKTYAELEIAKPKSRGRGLSADSLGRAMAGSTVPRLVRHKILRAVNAKLASAKKEPIDSRLLFNDVRVKRGKSKKK